MRNLSLAGADRFSTSSCWRRNAISASRAEPGWLEKHKGGPGGGRKRRQLNSQHYIAPPRPGEPAAVTNIRNMLNQTPTGRNAMYIYDRDNVQPVIGAPGAGTVYTDTTNTVTLDPTSTTPASHFVHHADAQNSGTTPNINTASRADYVNGNLAEEAHGEALAEQAHNELAATGTPEAASRSPFTGPAYDTASQNGANAYRTAHPDAPQSEVDDAGRQAGEQAVRLLGPVDGFNQDEGAGKGDECAVAVLGFVTTHGNPLVALQLADGLLNSGTRLVEQSGKELRLVLGVLAIRNNRNDAAATAGCPIGR